MKLKVALLLCTIFCLSNFAEAESYKPVKSKRIIQPSATSIVSSSYYNSDYVNEDYYVIIDNLKKELEKNPDNHEIIISLVDCYINVKNYDEALILLNFLLDEKHNENLSPATIFEIKQLSAKTTNKNKYTKYKSPVCVCLAVMSLILDEEEQALDHIKHAVANAKYKRVLVNGIDIISNYTNAPEEIITICNLYLSLYKYDLKQNNENTELYNEILNKKLSLLADSGNAEEVIKTYENEDINTENLSEEALLKTVLMMQEKNYSDKEIVNIFYDKNVEKEVVGYYNLCDLFLNFDDKVNAQIWLDKMEDKFPKSVKTKLATAKFLIKSGQTTEASEYLESIKNEITDEQEIAEYNFLITQLAEEPFNEAAALADKGHYQQAIDILEKLPQNALTLSVIGRFQIQQKNFDEAIICLNKAIALDENNPIPNCQLGFYYYELGDFATARKYVNKILKIDPNNEYAKSLEADINKSEAEGYTKKIASALDAQNYNEAMSYVNQALKIDANSSNMYFYKGLIYIAQSNFAASTAALYKSIELDETNILPYYYLGFAFDNLSEPDNAVVYYKKFLELLPNDSYGESERVQYAQARIQKILSSK